MAVSVVANSDAVNNIRSFILPLDRTAKAWCLSTSIVQAQAHRLCFWYPCLTILASQHERPDNVLRMAEQHAENAAWQGRERSNNFDKKYFLFYILRTKTTLAPNLDCDLRAPLRRLEA
jgi:hypothetical protein